MGMAFPEDQAVLPSAFCFQWPLAFISKNLFLCSQIIPANHFSLLFQPLPWLRIVSISQQATRMFGVTSVDLAAFSLASSFSDHLYISILFNHKPPSLASGLWTSRCALVYRLLEKNEKSPDMQYVPISGAQILPGASQHITGGLFLSLHLAGSWVVLGFCSDIASSRMTFLTGTHLSPAWQRLCVFTCLLANIGYK